MTLQTLGRLALEDSAFTWPKPLALLAYLALEGPQERRRVARLFWPAATDPMNSLTVALSQLRKGAPGAVEADRSVVASRLDCDADALCEALASAELEHALQLYQGPFLYGFQLRQEGVEFEEWVFAQRERLADLLRRELLTRATAAAAAARFDLATGYAERAAALDEAPPLPPDQIEHLHQLLLAGGSDAAAEVGVEAESFGATLAQSQSEARTRLRQVLQAPALPHAVPRFGTPFLGREAQLDALEQAVGREQVRLITLLGPGGSGKTRLAVALAERIVARASATVSAFPDGVWFVPLAGVVGANEVVPAIAGILGTDSWVEGSTQAPEQRLLTSLHTKQLLLILDNVEQLRHDEHVAVLHRLLEAAPGLTLLTTSRDRLGWQDEQLYYVRGLDLPAGETDSAVVGSPAAQLFCQRARRVAPDFEFAPSDVPGLLDVCRLVEGMPLGLELAATWVTTMSLADIAAGIRRSLDFLSSDLRDVPARQRSLRAVFDYAYDQLAPVTRLLFARLSAFSGGFTREAAEQVADAEPRLLATLVTASLVEYDRTRERYHLHELLRQYGSELLNTADSEAVGDRHSEYYCGWLAQLAPHVPGSYQPHALATIEPEAENVRLAWQRALRHGREDLVGVSADPLGTFWQRRGRLQEGAQAFAAAAEALALRHNPRLQARLEIWMATFTFLLGDRDAAIAQLDRCLVSLDRAANDGISVQTERAGALLRLGSIRLNSDAAAAESLAEESLETYRRLKDGVGVADALEVLGTAVFRGGDGESARALLEESLTLRRALDDDAGVAALLPMLAFLALYGARFADAESLARESYAICRPLGDRARQADSLSLLGMSHFWLGRFAEARTLFEESLALHEEIGNRHALPQARAYVGLASLRLGRYQEACVHAERAVLQARDANDRAMVGWGLWLRGSASLGLGQLGQARQQLRESIAIYREIGQVSELGWSLAVLALVERQLHRPDTVRSLLLEAVERSLPRHDFPTAILALPVLALLRLDASEAEQAVELLALMLRYPVVANCHWFEDIAIRHLRDVEVTLPPDVTAAAREHGAAQDLWEVIALATAGLSPRG